VNVQPATKQDLDVLVRMARDWNDAGKLDQAGLEFDPDTVRSLFRLSILQGYCLVAVDAAQQLVGVISAIRYPWLGNARQLVLNEIIWWVDPHARGYRAGSQLREALETLAFRDPLVHGLVISVMSASRPSVAAAMAENGYAPMQTQFYKETIHAGIQ